MARYCPKCYTAIDKEDTICGNCKNVLIKNESEKEVSDSTKESIPDQDIFTDITEEALLSDEEITDIPFEEVLLEEKASEEKASEKKSSEVTTGISDFESFEEKTSEKSFEENSKEISLGEWMLTLLLTYIPIVNIVMLIIWSVDAKTNPSKKNFSLAQLIYMAIGVVLSLVFFSAIFALLVATLNVSSPGHFYY